MATHPLQTLAEMAQGIDSLAQVLDHCLWRFNEFVIDVYRQPEKAQADFGFFCESALKLNQEIRQKIYEKCFAECSRECAKFATETFLIGKLTDFALIGCSAIESQAQYLLDNYKGLVQEAESITAVTTEGLEIRLTQKAENCVFSEMQDITGKQPPGIIITEKLPKLSEAGREEAVRFATTESKIEHIFRKTKHNLTPLVEIFKTEENVVRAILDASAGKLPVSGVFKDVVVNVSGYDVYIRGRVMEGIPKLGTFFIK